MSSSKVLSVTFILLFLSGSVTVAQETSIPPEISETGCDATTPCPEGLECSHFPEIGTRCAQPNPCDYFCPEDTQCTLTLSYPPQVECTLIAKNGESEEEKPEDIEVMESEIIGTVNLDEDIQPEDLEVGTPRILPDSRLYFFKEGWRKVKEFFTFNAVAKMQLKQRFSSERIVELKELVKRGAQPKIIEKATEKYNQENEQIRKRVMELGQKAGENPELNSFLDKFVHQQTLHYRILQKLEEQVPPEVLEKIREQRERHLERFKDVMLKLEEKEKIPERLEQVMEKIKGSDFKEFKNLEVLKELEEKVPENAKEKIKEVEGNILKKFQEKLEEMSAEKQERFKEYIENISGEKERHLEILENLKFETPKMSELQEKLEEGKIKIFKKIEEKVEKIDCPQFTPPHAEFCKEGRVVVERDPKTGCYLAPRCIIPREVECEVFITCEEGYFPQATGEKDEQGCPIKKCVKEEEAEKEMACITLWDPICGVDEKTYSNECFAKVAGMKVAHKGVCEEKTEGPEAEE